MHLLPIGLLPFNQAAAFQADAGKEPPGPAVREDGGRASQGDISLQIPVKQGVSSHPREALHPQTAKAALTSDPTRARLPQAFTRLPPVASLHGPEGAGKGGQGQGQGPGLSQGGQSRGHSDSFPPPVFLSPNREYSPGAKDWVLFTLRVSVELRHLLR